MRLKITPLGLFCFFVIFLTTTVRAQDLNTDSTGTKEKEIDAVVIVGKGVIDVAKDRETPVAVSTIKKQEIKDKSGNQEFPAIMKNTPSVFTWGESSGYGEANMYVRGFDQSNTAFLINGQPINAVEDGKVYWSNWSGLTDIANSVQVQRGLGSSKLAISSVGGTINIVTKATEKTAGSSAKLLVGNNGYWKASYEYNSGLQGKWGFSLLTSTWRGDGYNHGTRGEGQIYFLSVGYKPNENHTVNFMVYGAPQKHDQSSYTSIKDYQKYGRKYNVNEGWLQEEQLSLRTNYYHKPVANLNWDWKINEKTNLSTVLYASWGRGGGTGGFGSTSGISGYRDPETGTINWNAVENYNKANNVNGIGINKATGGKNANYILRASVNNHQWYGLVSNLNYKINKNLQFNVGVDGRTYTGTHYQKAYRFLGLAGIEDTSNNVNNGNSNIVTKAYSINPWRALFENVDDKQKLGYDYDETIQYIGGFGQVEYSNRFLSAFIQGSVSEQSHYREDRFNYVPGEQKSKNLSNTGYNIKGGLNFKITPHHNIFGNAGYYSRQPYQDNLFLNYKNDVNPLASNEKIIGVELGYQLNYSIAELNINVYKTYWNDRVETISHQTATLNTLENRTGIDELHQGIEIDFLIKPFRQLRFKGHLSAGTWEYNGNAHSTTYDYDDLSVLSEKTILLDGVKTANAPQFSYGIGLIYNPFKGFSFDADLNRYEKLYSDFDVIAAKPDEKIEMLELPDYLTLDLGASYNIYFDSSSLRFRVNVNNALNEIFMTYCRTNYKAGSETYKGIDVSNQVYFGNGRTWNFGVTYNF
ncbi:MAG: TonB-dependent receptor plug domain-containing protein [Flavobacteriaceae bacterium]|jgi:outer membrane cobalamin receptor|nr:TonB-dependent receptor plug domain-containing protein [Flavobacteriaceae bacterium]